MSTDAIGPLIPWYVTGTLGAEDCARVEEHLSGCGSCRALLATARAFRRLAPGIAPEVVQGHVQAQLLVEYADDPAALEPDSRRLVTTHLASCKVCAEALEVVEDLGSTAGVGAPAVPGDSDPLGAVRRAWRFITRTFLHPLPALAYLAALVALLVMLPQRERERGAAPSVSVLPRAAVLPEEFVARGALEEPAAPIDVPLRDGEPVLLELVTSIEAERLEDPAAAFRVVITAGERLVFETLRSGSEFERSGRLRLLLDPEGLAPGTLHTVRLTFVKPGEPYDGEEAFRRTFRLVPSGRPSP